MVAVAEVTWCNGLCQAPTVQLAEQAWGILLPASGLPLLTDTALMEVFLYIAALSMPNQNKIKHHV